MKIFFFVLFVFTAGLKLSAQVIRAVQFVHVGPELRPIGTLLTSPEKYSVPAVRASDRKLGTSITTDKTTFQYILSFVEKSTHLNADTSKTDGYPDYKIIQVNGQILYLGNNDKNKFLQELAENLASKYADKKVIDAIIYRSHHM